MQIKQYVLAFKFSISFNYYYSHSFYCILSTLGLTEMPVDLMITRIVFDYPNTNTTTENLCLALPLLPFEGGNLVRQKPFSTDDDDLN